MIALKNFLPIFAVCFLGLSLPHGQVESREELVDYGQSPRVAGGAFYLTQSESTMNDEKLPGPGEKEPAKVEQKIPHQEQGPDQIKHLRDQIVELQNKGKLGFRKVVVCSSVEGFGVYSPIEPGQPLSKLILYVEPENVSTLLSNDRYIVDCGVSFGIVDSAGKGLIGAKNLKFNKVSRSPILDLHYKIELDPKKLASGQLFFKMTLNDKIKNQSASITTKFSLQSARQKKPLDRI